MAPDQDELMYRAREISILFREICGTIPSSDARVFAVEHDLKTAVTEY